MFSEFRFTDIVAITHRVMDQIDQNLEKQQAIEKAKAVGTLGAIDRAPQYSDMEHRQIVKAVNEGWAKIRTVEKAGSEKDQRIGELETRLFYAFLLVTGRWAWDFVQLLARHLHWLGFLNS
jgi:hypothetical protein